MKTGIILHGIVLTGMFMANNAPANDKVAPPSLKHRMGTIVVRTTPGAKVTVRQLAHEFWFGTAINRRAFINGELAMADKEKYLAVLKDNFNSAVHENALKWYSTEKTQGETTYAEADAVLTWCTDNGLRMRGHCVYWAVDTFVQDWLKQLDNQDLRRAVESRAMGLLTHYRGKITEFDVNNEMLHGSFYAKRLGESIRREMFLWCKKANPAAVLYVNDYGILTGNDLSRYERQIESLLAQGTPIGGIGLQGHFGGRVDKEHVKRVLDSLSRFELPIKITEFDMKTLDEDAKAKGLEDLYRVAFEHPSVEGILMWGFWADSHWLSSKRWGIEGYTALWDKDWKPMPAAQAYRNLVFKEWWTDYEGTADEQGICEVPVFLGRHKVKVPGGELIVELSKSETRQQVNLQAQQAPSGDVLKAAPEE
jgi:endo-1,4-beta-xylanase